MDVVTYSAGQPARLEYSFEDHTFAIPQTEDGLEVLQTLMGPGSIRLTAATGHQTLAILRVRRTGGRAPTLLYGGDANTTSQSNAPAVVSLPKSRTVVRGGATSLFVSRIGEESKLSMEEGKSGIERYSSWFESTGRKCQNSGCYPSHTFLIRSKGGRQWAIHRGD